MTLSEWVSDCEKRGKVTFTTKDAFCALQGVAVRNIQVELNRLVLRKRIQNIYRGFYVIVPPQYALKGVIPATYYVDALMCSIRKPYYVSLLSAATLHGATHQRAMTTHVMMAAPRPTISARNKQISWCFRKEIPDSLLLSTNIEMGIMKYSNAELTAVDLVQFASYVGGYQRAATALAEMIEEVDVRKIERVLPYTSCAVVQRLGYILEFVFSLQEKSDEFYRLLEKNRRKWHSVKMLNEKPTVAQTSNRWRVNMNIDIEIDEI